MQQKVHGGEAGGAIDELVAADQVALQFVPLGRCHRCGPVLGKIVRDEEEAAGAAGWVDDRV